MIGQRVIHHCKSFVYSIENELKNKRTYNLRSIYSIRFVQVQRAFSRQNGILRWNGNCIQTTNKTMSENEQIHQNSMIAIGECLGMYGEEFVKICSNFTRIFWTHKRETCRCSHGYLLTSCSAGAIIEQIHSKIK